MPSHRKSYALLIGAMALLIISAAFAEQATTNQTLQAAKRANLQSTIDTIALNDETESFSRYNTNGTPAYLNDTSAIFYGSNKTNIYSDMISHNNIKADKSLVLEAQITANATNFSIGKISLQSSLQTTSLTSAPTNSASCYQKWETLGTLTSNHPR